MSAKKSSLSAAAWFCRFDKTGFMDRSWIKNQSTPDPEFQGKSVTGIRNTWSELTACNAHLRNLASMDVEQAIRGKAIDGVLLLVSCRGAGVPRHSH